MKCWQLNKKNPVNRVKDIKFDCDYSSFSTERVIGALSTVAAIKKCSEKRKGKENELNN